MIMQNTVDVFADGSDHPEERLLLNPTIRSVVFIGVLGGFTTFSSYGLETLTLLPDGQLGQAALNVGISDPLGLVMAWVGYVLMKSL